MSPPRGPGIVSEMHKLAVLSLVGPQGSRWSLFSTVQTWEAQVGPSLAGKTLLLSEAFSKKVKCFQREEMNIMMANPLAELQWSLPSPVKGKH